MNISDIIHLRQFVPGIITAALSMLLVVTKGFHGKYSCDTTIGIQKFHTRQTPRVGGIAIFSGFIVAWLFSFSSLTPLFGFLLVASLPAFIAGLTEDLTKRVGVRTRLIATMVSGLLAWKFTGYSLTHIEIPGIDSLLAHQSLAVFFTAFAVAGVANATNIIDGFNGLAAGTMAVCYTALGIIAWQVGDMELVELCIVLTVVTFGFLVVNFPFGKIFMGDGGAYLLGFMLAWVSVMLTMRNPSVSVWAPFLVSSYPIIETLFSMGRRYINKENPGLPDIAHLHSLIKIRIVNRHFSNIPQALRNGMVSPFCWLYTLIPSILAVLFYNQTAILIVAWVFCYLLYVIIYRSIVSNPWKKIHEAESRYRRDTAPSALAGKINTDKANQAEKYQD